MILKKHYQKNVALDLFYQGFNQPLCFICNPHKHTPSTWTRRNVSLRCNAFWQNNNNPKNGI